MAAVAFGLAAPALAADAPEWRAVDEATGQIRDVEGLEQLALDFPDSGTVRLRLLQPLLAAGEAERIMELLEWLYDRGYVFSDVAQAQIPKLLAGVDPGRIAERLRAEAEVIEASEAIATVPAETGLIETVVSPDDGILVVTSITQQAGFASMDGTDWQRLEMPMANDLSGLVADTERNIGWFASSNIDQSEVDGARFNGLIGLSNGSDQPILVPAPEGVTLSDLELGFDGAVYASDPLNGGVYVARPNSTELEVLVAPGTLRSPQGLAVGEYGNLLYVSDYRYGIAIVDLADGSVSRLASDIPIILDGVDGLWRYGHELIAVQNGTSPMRISAFELSKDGTRITGHRILEQTHSDWTEPLSGSIDGDALIYIGNGQWDRYIEGELKEGMEALPTQIRRLRLTDPAK